MYKSLMRTFAMASLLFAAITVAGAQTPLKIGVFDPQRVSEEASAGKKAQADLEAVRASKQQDITRREGEITALQEQLKAQALSLSIDKRAELEIKIQRSLLELDSSKDLATRELQLQIAAEEAKFNEKLRVVLERFSSDGGFDLLLDRGAVAWASSKTDVTTAIIDMFDAAFPASGQ